MTDFAFLAIMLIGVFGALVRGIPVMLALLGVPIIVALLAGAMGFFDLSILGALPGRVFGIMASELLYAVPLFLFLGKVLEHSGIAERAFAYLLGKEKTNHRWLALGILGISVVLACSSGVVGATIIMLGTIAYPTMRKVGLGQRFSSGLICSSGTLGQLLPPSLVLILLGDQISSANQIAQRELGNFASEPVVIGQLFAGALLPGFLLVLFYALFVIWSTKRAPTGLAADAAGSQIAAGSLACLIVLFLLVLVPVSIITGLATVNEAAAIGVLIALTAATLIGSIQKLRVAMVETVELTGAIFGIIIAASSFSLILRAFNGDVYVQSLLTGLPGNGELAVLAVLLLVFLLGFVMEFVEINYIVVPVAAPTLFMMGVDPVWFAILLGLCLQMSFLTPPMGISLFYFQSVHPMPLRKLSVAILPFLLMQIGLVFLVFAAPNLVTWLPALLI